MFWFRFSWIVLIAFEPVHCLVQESSGNPCGSGGTTGWDLATGTVQPPENNIGFNFMAETPEYMFPCCAKVSTWKYRAGNKGLLQVQVWRRKSTSVYEMIGENYCDVTTTGSTQTCAIDEKDKIFVQQGDLIGWHNEADDILQYNEVTFTSSDYPNMFRRRKVNDLTVGSEYDWNDVDAYNDRYFFLQATYETDTAPVITLAPESVNVPDYMVSGTTIGHLAMNDPDLTDNDTLILQQTTTSVMYGLNLATGRIYSTNAHQPRAVVNTLTYFLYDQCYKSHEKSLSVFRVVTTLVISSLPASVTVSESVTTQIRLTDINVTDPLDQWRCTAGWTNQFFFLKAESTTTYGLYLAEHAGLTCTTTTAATHTLTVNCLENRVNSVNTVTGTVSVYVICNQPPVLTNLDASVIVNASSTYIGDTLFTVTASDPEGDHVTFSMACPVVACCNVLHLTETGNLQVTNWLIRTTTSLCTLTITATDTKPNTDVGYLHVSFADLNEDATFVHVPPTDVHILENTAVGTFIYKFMFDDMDWSDTKVWSTSYSDNKMTRYLSIDPATGILTTAFSEIDYEDLGGVFTYQLTLAVDDIKSRHTQVLNINIGNVNEAPLFKRDNFVVEVNEGADNQQAVAGTLFSSNFVDVDIGDTHTYSLDCDTATNTQRFYIDFSSGAITYKGAYDLEVTGTPTDVACVVTVSDEKGLNDSVNLHMHVKNVNEFTPEFTQSVFSVVYLSMNSLVGTSVMSVLAVDFDTSDDYDNDITYWMDPPDNTLFQVSHTGVVYMASTPAAATAGSTVVVYAANDGIAARTGSATFTYIVASTTTTSATTTTDRYKGFFEDGLNYNWMILTFSGVTMIILAITVVCFRICRLTRIQPWCYRCCMNGLCCRPKPIPPRGFGDHGYDLASFGHKHQYADDIDGWLKRERRADAGYGYTRVPRTPVETAGGRFGTPPAGYNGPSDHFRESPIFDMFHVPTPGPVPAAARYMDPTQTSKLLRSWKNRKPTSSLKPNRSTVYPGVHRR